MNRVWYVMNSRPSLRRCSTELCPCETSTVSSVIGPPLHSTDDVSRTPVSFVRLSGISPAQIAGLPFWSTYGPVRCFERKMRIW